VYVIRIGNNSQSLWRFNRATKELRQVSFGLEDSESDCTPDGKAIVLNSFDPKTGGFVLSFLKTDGGSPKELARGQISTPKVSPDGKLVLFLQLDGQGQSGKLKFVVKSLEDGSARDVLAPPGSLSPSWTPDGHGIAYLYRQDGPADLFIQKLSGGKPIRIMHFDDEPASITAYAWSRNGKKIAVTRSRFNNSDIVLFTGLR